MQRSQIVLLLYLGRALVLGRPRRFRAPNRGSLAAEVCDWNSATQPNLSIFGCQHRPVRLTTWQKDTKSQNTCLGTSKFPWMYMADQITQVKWTCFHCVMEWSEWSIEQSCLQDLTRPRPRSLILWIILFFPNAIFVPLDIFSMWGAQMKSTEKKNISYFTHPIMFRPLAARICRFASAAYRVLQANGYYAVCSLASSRFAGVISTAWMRSLDW